MFIQDNLKIRREELEKYFTKHSMFTPQELFNKYDYNAISHEKKNLLENRIQSMYLFWLMMIVAEMEKKPRFEFANTIEDILNMHIDLSIDAMYSTTSDFFDSKGLFSHNLANYADYAYTNHEMTNCNLYNSNLFDTHMLTTGGIARFPYSYSYGSWSTGDIAGDIKILCELYIQRFVVKGINYPKTFLNKLKRNQLKRELTDASYFKNCKNFKDYLKRCCLTAINRYDFFMSLETDEFKELMSQYGVQNVAVRWDVDDLAKILDALVNNRTDKYVVAALSQFNQSCRPALCYYIKYLLR